MRTKKCGRCGAELPITSFGKNATKNDGLQSWCRSCRSGYYYYMLGEGKYARKRDAFPLNRQTDSRTDTACGDATNNWQYQTSAGAIYNAIADLRHKTDDLHLMVAEKTSGYGAGFAAGALCGAGAFLLVAFIVEVIIRL